MLKSIQSGFGEALGFIAVVVALGAMIGRYGEESPIETLALAPDFLVAKLTAVYLQEWRVAPSVWRIP